MDWRDRHFYYLTYKASARQYVWFSFINQLCAESFLARSARRFSRGSLTCPSDASITPVALLSSPQCRLFFLDCCGFCGRFIPNTDFLGMQSELPSLQVTTVTNDEVQEYHTELFAFDP